MKIHEVYIRSIQPTFSLLPVHDFALVTRVSSLVEALFLLK